MSDPQSVFDLQELCDVARMLAAALDERVKATTDEEAADKAAEAAHARSKEQRVALDALLAEFRAAPPVEEEVGAILGHLREARGEELRLHAAEADLRIAHLDAKRRTLKARMRAIYLIDSLDANPLIDWALAQRKEEPAATTLGPPAVMAEAPPAVVAPADPGPAEAPPAVPEQAPKRGRRKKAAATKEGAGP
jgi:hypothetical protein